MKTLFVKALMWYMSFKLVKIYLYFTGHLAIALFRSLRNLMRRDHELALGELRFWFYGAKSHIVGLFSKAEEPVTEVRTLSLDELPEEIRAAMAQADAL